MSTEHDHELSHLEGVWHLDPNHSWIGLSVRYAGVANIQAWFTNAASSLRFTDDGVVTVQATVLTESIQSGNIARDDHLQTEDFLWAEEYPTIDFHGVADRERMCGALRICGVAKDITFDIQDFGHTVDANGMPRIGTEATAEISRKDYGMTWNTSLRDGGLLVSDTVRLQIYASFIQADNNRVSDEEVPHEFLTSYGASNELTS